MYKEYKPDIRLQKFIRAYWVSDAVVSSRTTQRILPDGCVDIIFNFTDNDGSGRLFPYRPHIIGTMTSFLDVTYYSGKIQMLGICFHPAGITAFTRIPVFELTNKTVELALTETLFKKSFYDRLPAFSTMEERIIDLEKYLLSCLADFYLPEQRINFAVEYIQNQNGLISVKQVAEKACLSERQFERRFKNAVGISPKMFNRIIKFKHTLNYMKNNPNENFYSIALECGYFDHSHLIKDFKEFGGALPSELI